VWWSLTASPTESFVARIVPNDIQRVHGITDQMVQGKPTIDQILPQLIEFLGLPDTILLAHNVPFDLSFLAMA
jgi:DNA polymerase III subunit epsilon